MAGHDDPLLWSLDEVGRQLGGISVRSVRRLLDRGALPKTSVGGRIMVPSAAVREYVEAQTVPAHNGSCVGQGALAPTRGNSACLNKPKGSLKNRTASTGTPTSPTQAADALNALLGL
ncbi:MAG: helix-turn-helix domain-containing protein, partial [Sulfitobacter sp.]|nr:helix-turn-helix domain-containing protein [Sulfitobacter sp.]